MNESNKHPRKDPEFEALLEFMRDSRNLDFTGYKRSSLMRRVTKRMQSANIEKFSDYLRYLEQHSDEYNQLFNTILINVTSFFRDSDAWEFLATKVIPKIVENKRKRDHIRAWCVGCSSGEEAYTLAVVLAEVLGKEQFRSRVKIYATDIDVEALNKARHGTYTVKEVEDFPEDLRDKYFDQTGNLHGFKKDLRRSIIFGIHDVVQAAPISHLDVLVCRNTLMYFTGDTQQRILSRFHFALNNNGVLFLGMAEAMLTRDNLFAPISQKHRIFAKVPQVALREHLVFLNKEDSEYPIQTPDAVKLAEVAFTCAPDAQLVVDTTGVLTSANKEAFQLLRLDTADVGRPLSQSRAYRHPIEIQPLLQEAYRENRPVTRANVELPALDDKTQFLEVYVVPLYDDTGKQMGAGITFKDITRYKQLQDQVQKAHAELESAYEELQASSEELEATNEELQSTVEELETTNEELQSSNEEMETMNEELHATNEELQTMNDELHMRTDDLNRTNAFRESILRSVPMAVVVVDTKFRILMWNETAQDMWGLRAEEVEGVSFLNLDIGLPVAKIKTAITSVLESDDKIKELSLKAMNRRGRPVVCRIACTQLTGHGDGIEGVIMLMETQEDASKSS